MLTHPDDSPRKGPDDNTGEGPKRPYSYSEGADEAPKLIDEEPVEIEESIPAEKRSSIEGVEPEDENTPPLFEE